MHFSIWREWNNFHWFEDLIHRMANERVGNQRFLSLYTSIVTIGRRQAGLFPPTWQSWLIGPTLFFKDFATLEYCLNLRQVVHQQPSCYLHTEIHPKWLFRPTFTSSVTTFPLSLAIDMSGWAPWPQFRSTPPELWMGLTAFSLQRFLKLFQVEYKLPFMSAMPIFCHNVGNLVRFSNPVLDFEVV
jgi:hypothetical protein